MVKKEKLATNGGTPSVSRSLPHPERWDQREAQQLAGMISQRSLFYWNGPQTNLLLERFRCRYPLDFVMPCASGTAAIHVAMLAAGIGPGDEVITSPITDMGTVIGILYQQGVPVFADLEPHSYNLDPAKVAQNITPKTKAILAVHLACNPCAMKELLNLAERHNLILIEDCAQAWGALYRGEPVGTLGHIACFSFNDFKHISCGDGGIVATHVKELGSRLQLYADKGYDRTRGTRSPEFLAPNYRISEPQSAIAAIQMEKMEQIAATRNRLGNFLTSELSGTPGIRCHKVNAADFCSYWFYMMRVVPPELTCGTEEFIDSLVAEGVPASGAYIPTPLYQYPVFQNANFFAGRWPAKEMGLTDMDYKKVSCPESESILKEAVKIVINEAMDEKYMTAIARAIRRVSRHYNKES